MEIEINILVIIVGLIVGYSWLFEFARRWRKVERTVKNSSIGPYKYAVNKLLLWTFFGLIIQPFKLLIRIGIFIHEF